MNLDLDINNFTKVRFTHNLISVRRTSAINKQILNISIHYSECQYNLLEYY